MKLHTSECARLWHSHGKMIPVGQNIYLNHDPCPAGKDRKARLNIKRLEEGVLIRCNHCGYTGHFFPSPRGRKPKTIEKPANTGCKLPADYTLDYALWPDAAQQWLISANIPDSARLHGRLGYSPSLNRVILPYFHDGELTGYQARRLGTNGPKYLTYTDGTHRNWAYYSRNSDTLVLCEDILSALRVWSLGVDSIAMLSTALPKTALEAVVSGDYQKAYVWLDHDNAEVRRCERRLVRSLSSFIPEVVHVKLTDPKRLPDSRLEDTLNASG